MWRVRGEYTGRQRPCSICKSIESFQASCEVREAALKLYMATGKQVRVQGLRVMAGRQRAAELPLPTTPLHCIRCPRWPVLLANSTAIHPPPPSKPTPAAIHEGVPN